MGFFRTLFGGIGRALGSVDEELLATGLAGRGELVSFEPTSTTVTIGNGFEERVCQIGLRVLLDHREPYEVSVRQRVPEIFIPRLTQQGVVAVRVDPADPTRVALDLNAPIPEVTLTRRTGPGSAAWILEHGTPLEVVLVQAEPMGVKDADEHEVFRLKLTVLGPGDPIQVEVGNAVPAAALPLLYPGARLHARRGDAPEQIVVDFARGLAGPAGAPGSASA
ncbi:MAG: hypothetical protein J0G30_11480 [Actinomycetales bacterium]|nr:hypothetical protein [Actinomycetales bacterium]